MQNSPSAEFNTPDSLATKLTALSYKNVTSKVISSHHNHILTFRDVRIPFLFSNVPRLRFIQSGRAFLYLTWSKSN